MSNGFGKANIDTQYEGYKYFKLRTPDPKKGETETEIVLRLLPSMKSYKDTGEWKFFYGQHYGYSGVNSRDPSKPRSRPFKCIQKKNGKTKEIEIACPKCTQMSKFEARKQAREDELAKEHGIGAEKEARQSPEFYAIKKDDAKYQQIAAWLSKHNCDKKFWMNAMDRDGNFGVLQLSYSTTNEKLLPLLRKLSSGEETGDKVDAFDPSSGIWLKFTRSGKIPRVVDSIAVFTVIEEIAPGKKVRVPAPAPMSTEQIEKALKTCPDLAKDVVKTITTEQIQQLVDCNGDPDVVDGIWPPEVSKSTKKVEDTSTKTTSTTGGEFDAGDNFVDGDVVEEPASEPSTTKTKEEPKTETKAAVGEEDEDAAAEAALAKQTAELKARIAAKAAAKAAAATATPALGKTVDNADDFLAQFNAK
jgi:hypothetical protein